MDKAKRQPKNFFRYLLDEFILFRRDFYFELEIEPEIVVEKLRALKYEKQTGWGIKRISHKITENSGSWHFVTTIIEKNNRGYDYSDIAKGDIYAQGQLTVLEGQVTIGSKGYIFLISFIGLCLALIFIRGFLMIGTKGLTAIVGLAVVVVFSWIWGYIDRNNVYNLIKSAVESVYGNNNEAKAS
jgi:hypothetical protein